MKPDANEARADRGGARPSPRLLAIAKPYLGRYLARHFTALRIERGAGADALSGPTVFYANHPSWWDPIVLVLLIATHYPDWEFQGPIDASALARYPWLERIGLFGVEPGTAKGARELMRRGSALLSAPNKGLALTAQGGFTDVRRRPVVLKRGLARLLAEHPAAAAIPIAIEYTFWNERLPEALVRFGRVPVTADGRDSAAIHAALERSLEAELDRLADAAASRDPERFDCLIEGRCGVGFWQDLPHKLRALARGERFDPAHAAVGAARRDGAGRPPPAAPERR